jgi:NitT/TauT family transport system permease protein
MDGSEHQEAVKPAAAKRGGWAPSRESIAGIAAVVVFVIAWHLASFVAPTYAVPSWQRIINALLRVSYDDVAVTLVRLLGSMVVSFVIGLAMSMLVFERPYVEAFSLPYIRLLMAVPAVCWVVFSILWFKPIEFRILFVMCVVCIPVFFVDSLDAMKAVPLELRQMVDSFRPSRWQYYTKVILPGILPNILTSWKINLSLAVRVIITAELVGAVSGIGHGLILAQENFSVAEVFAWTGVLVIILFMFQGVMNLIERHALRWRTV